MLKSGAKFEDLRFSRNDKFIEIINISIGNADNYTLIEKIEIKNLNKKVFNNLELAIRLNEFDFEVFKNKKWFEEINFTKVNTSSDIIVFSVDKYVLKNLEFNNFANNKQLINNDTLSEDHINLISAGLSFSLGKFYGENLHLKIDGAREIITQYFDITNFSLLEWGRWNTKNSSDYDYNTDTIVTTAASSFDSLKFNKSEILNFVNDFDFNSKYFDWENEYAVIFNMIDNLGNSITKDIVLKNKTTNAKIGSVKNFSIKNLKFDYIGNQKQKFLTNLDLNIDGIDLNLAEVSPEFSSYFKLLGYDTVKFDFGTSWNWNKQKNDLGINIDLGVTNAASIALSTIFSGLSSEIFNMQADSLGAYLLTNFKINDIKLSLIDNSLRDKLFNFAAKQENVSVKEFKKTLISQIDSYSVTTQKTKLFVEYRQAVVNFINGSRKIKLQISPEMPISIAELSPYFLNPDINSIISKLNLYVSN